jgi:hypothetical protein
VIRTPERGKLGESTDLLPKISVDPWNLLQIPNLPFSPWLSKFNERYTLEELRRLEPLTLDYTADDRLCRAEAAPLTRGADPTGGLAAAVRLCRTPDDGGGVV